MFAIKQLVNVYVPSISQTFDLLVPVDLEIEKLIPLLSEAIETLSANQYIKTGEEALCSSEKKVILMGESTLADYSIKHGEHLITQDICLESTI